jgi:hypothetical protein
LTENGVPDDDMSDSLPPNGGPGPYDGWDLEGLLSGRNVWLPDGMRPVAGTLAALRSAPAGTELSGEAAARAAFRDIMRAGATGPAVPGGGARDASTLILPTRTLGGGPPVAARPRHSHRRPPQRGRWRSKALVGGPGLRIGVAVVLVVGGIALAGTFSGGGQQKQPGLGSGGTSAAPQTTHPGSNGVEGTASTEPTTPAPSASTARQSSGSSDSTSGPSALCRQYLEFIARPESHSDWAEESDNFQQLSHLAGGPWHITGYCMALQPWSMTAKGAESHLGGLGFPPPGSQDPAGGVGSQGDKASQHEGNTGSGASGGSGVGNDGSGSQQGASGPGAGSQGRQ